MDIQMILNRHYSSIVIRPLLRHVINPTMVNCSGNGNRNEGANLSDPCRNLGRTNHYPVSSLVVFLEV